MLTLSDSRYRSCCLCPRECGVDRIAGVTGLCGETAVIRVASMAPHFGEEPCISGSCGSGTVFLSGCSTGCFFCQNWQISHGGGGEPLSLSDLCARLQGLIQQGVHNLNLVTPDHFLPHLHIAVRRLRDGGLRLPIVWNCSGYQRPESVSVVSEIADIFLVDFKFGNADLAQECIGDRRYPAIASAAIKRMVEEKGFLSPWDETGRVTAESGVLVRHLVLPGHVENSLRVIDMLHDAHGPDLPMSVMSQYRPMPACAGHGTMERSVSPREYDRVCQKVVDLEFERVFIQPAHGDEDFVPDFDEKEPFKGNRKQH